MSGPVGTSGNEWRSESWWASARPRVVESPLDGHCPGMSPTGHSSVHPTTRSGLRESPQSRRMEGLRRPSRTMNPLRLRPRWARCAAQREAHPRSSRRSARGRSREARARVAVEVAEPPCDRSPRVAGRHSPEGPPAMDFRPGARPVCSLVVVGLVRLLGPVSRRFLVGRGKARLVASLEADVLV